MSRYKAYLEYRDSGVKWLGEIPCDWDCVRLKFASELSGRKVAPSNDERYVGLENVQSNSGKFISTEEITPEGVSNAFSCGDVLFGKLRPYLAKSWLANFSGICSSEFLVLTSRKVDAKFLHYLTLTEEFIEQVDSSTYGSKMPRASWDFIGLLGIPAPPYESKKIAEFLDHEAAKIDALIEKQQRLIELLKEKRQAVISHAVTKGLNPNAPMKDSGVDWLGEVPAHWVTKRLKHISPKIGVGLVINPSTYTRDEGVYFIFGGDVKEYGFDLSNTRRISAQDSNSLLSSRLNQRDLVCVRVGYPGITAVVTEALTGSNCASVVVIRSGEFNSDWLCAAMNTWIGRQQVELCSYGAAQKQFNVSDAIDFLFPVPPPHEQDELADYVAKKLVRFNLLTSKAEDQISLLHERRTALISAAVTGKIDVRDWQAAA